MYLLDGTIYKNILIYHISYKTFVSSKPLRIWFYEIDGFLKIFDGIRYLVLLGHSWYDKICDMINFINYHVIEKSGIKDSINRYFARIRIDSNNSLLVEKTLNFHNFIILIKSVIDKNENNYFLKELMLIKQVQQKCVIFVVFFK